MQLVLKAPIVAEFQQMSRAQVSQASAFDERIKTPLTVSA